MTDYVRVSVPGGHVTVPAVYARAHQLTLLKSPATDVAGDPLPTKRRKHTQTPSTEGPATPATTNKAEEAHT